MREILLKLCRREDLTREETADAFNQIVSGGATEAQIGGLLIGLAAKGTTVEELVGAATVMREKTIGIACDPPGQVILDTCGTGEGCARHVQHLNSGGDHRGGGRGESGETWWAVGYFKKRIGGCAGKAGG